MMRGTAIAWPHGECAPSATFAARGKAFVVEPLPPGERVYSVLHRELVARGEDPVPIKFVESLPRSRRPHLLSWSQVHRHDPIAIVVRPGDSFQ